MVSAYLYGLALSVVHIVLGTIGIEHHLGVWAAAGAVIWMFVVYFILSRQFLPLFIQLNCAWLPLYIGTYFGVVDVIGWPWWAGVLIAAPGTISSAPIAFIWAAVSTALGRFRS